MRHIIFNNYYSNEHEESIRKSMFEEYHKERGWESPSDIPDSEVWEEIRLDEEIRWDAAEAELKRFIEDADTYFLVRGYVGRWNGRHYGGVLIKCFDDLYKLWDDCDYLSIYDEGGHLYIKCTHHDGTNFFEVKQLTNKGTEYLLNDYRWEDEEAQEMAFNSNFFTKLPHFAHEVYGTKKYS